MSGNALTKPEIPKDGPYAASLRAITAECLTARKCSQVDKALVLALGARVRGSVKDEYYRALGDLLTAPTNRGGETYENVVGFLDRMKRSEWTATELRRGLAREGVTLSSKRLADVTGYLVRAGRFKRLSRGYYIDAAADV